MPLKLSGVILDPDNKEEKKKYKRPERFKNWCITIFTDPLTPPKYDDKKLQFLAYGNEICPNSKKFHWQTYCGFHDGITKNQMKKFVFLNWGGMWHFEEMRGDLYDNEMYCAKEGTLIKHGSFPAQGARNDLVFWKDKIMKGEMTPDDICLENPSLISRHGRVLDRIHYIYMNTLFRTESTECYWYHGPTGTGKSHAAFEGFNPSTHYLWRNEKFWDGYKQQPIVIIQELRRGMIPYEILLQLIDKYAMYVPVKCKEAVPFISRKLIITSPFKPEEVYGMEGVTGDSVNQILRRIKVINLDKKYVSVK